MYNDMIYKEENKEAQMSVEMRILTCRLLEKMKSQEGYSKKIIVEDVSTFHGIKLNKSVRNGQERKGI